MNNTEYGRLQDTLDKKMKENLYTKYGRSGNWAEGYRQGILVAKSVLKSEFESRYKKEDASSE